MMNKVQITTLITKLENAEEGHPEFDFRTIYIVNDPEFNKKDLTSIVGGRRYIPTTGDKLYLTPGCNIPRFKVKRFCLDHDVALVKYKEKANAVFIGPESIQDLIVQDYYGSYAIPKDHFLKYLDRVVGSGDPRYMDLITAIKNSERDDVYVNAGVYNTLQAKTYFGIKLYKNDPLDKDEATRSKIELSIHSLENLKMLESYYKDVRVYNQDDMLKLLNTGGVMNAEMHESIKRLFESTDNQNTKLAMEAMANCDFEKSCVPLLLLIKQYGQKIYQSGNRNHVNFKALCKFFNIEDITRISLDTIINSLCAKKLLSQSNLELLMPLAAEQMKKNSQLEHFKVAEVDVSEEVKTAVSENILETTNVEIVGDPEEEITPNI